MNGVTRRDDESEIMDSRRQYMKKGRYETLHGTGVRL